MYYVTFLRMSHFLWYRCTRGGQGRFSGGLHGSTWWQGTACDGVCHVQEWQGFGFSVRHGMVGHGSGFLDLHAFTLLRELMFPSAVRSILTRQGSRTGLSPAHVHCRKLQI